MRIAGLGFALIVLAAVGWWLFGAPGMAPQGAGGLPEEMASARVSGVAEGAPIVTPVLPETISAEARMGQRAFEAKCVACHGDNAAGVMGSGPPLVHKIYEPSHHADYAFEMAVKNGVRAHHWRFGDMAPVEGLTGADIRAITAYVRELQRENGIGVN
ncbi:c-type cytochrome [Aquicoccus porphyridii]|uniref:c-type cytochrome n=1 Tax=Aquicoccus porphyridii TaxID=1852029 RepID=UPI0035154DF4